MQLKIFGPGGPYTPMTESAFAFFERTGIEVFVMMGTPDQWMALARTGADCIYGGAEYMMTDLAAEYPDMKLYQEIIFLRYNFTGYFVVENVKPYYEPLIPPTAELHRHLFWSNFSIPAAEFTQSKLRSAQIPDLQDYLGIDVSKYRLPNKRQVLRNCVLPELGEHVFNSAFAPF